MARAHLWVGSLLHRLHAAAPSIIILLRDFFVFETAWVAAPVYTVTVMILSPASGGAFFGIRILSVYGR